jgi:hypothetical protein
LKRKADKLIPIRWASPTIIKIRKLRRHIVWKFTDPGANLRAPNTRQCCIFLGISRSNSWKEMAERCEKEINSKQLFDGEAAKRYGKMLPQ